MPQLELTEEEVERLAKPVHGRGGLQYLLRRLQGAQHGSTVTIRYRDVVRLQRYLTLYGQGGFQSRLPIQALINKGLLPANYKPGDRL